MGIEPRNLTHPGTGAPERAGAKPDLTVLILTYNEALHIERAIRSILPVAKAVVVVDSLSSDDTVVLAEAMGATVLQNPFVTQAQQLTWAFAQAPLATEWIMRLDADEIIEADLQQRIAAELDGLPAGVNGVVLRRKHIFMDRWIRHGGRYPLEMLRIFRRGKGAVEDRWMDEHLYVTEGTTVTMKGGFQDWNLNDLSYFTAKHNAYATREALQVYAARRNLATGGEEVSADSASRRVRVRRWIKEKVYNRMPSFIGPFGYVFYRYVLQLGFLDGKAGLVYHVLQGFWYRFLVQSKVYEFEHALRGVDDPDEIRAGLKALTGYTLGRR